LRSAVGRQSKPPRLAIEYRLYFTLPHLGTAAVPTLGSTSLPPTCRKGSACWRAALPRKHTGRPRPVRRRRHGARRDRPMNPKQFHIPLKPEVKERKTRFEVLNEFVRSRNGWITSVPGDVERHHRVSAWIDSAGRASGARLRSCRHRRRRADRADRDHRAILHRH
jgi:hypothetical protein